MFRQPGPERDTVVQSLKGGGRRESPPGRSPGGGSRPRMALLAPWTALALVDATVYRSLRAGLPATRRHPPGNPHRR
ncbi:integral membrane protein, partial [Streptomyces sp. SPB78]